MFEEEYGVNGKQGNDRRKHGYKRSDSDFVGNLNKVFFGKNSAGLVVRARNKQAEYAHTDGYSENKADYVVAYIFCFEAENFINNFLEALVVG